MINFSKKIKKIILIAIIAVILVLLLVFTSTNNFSNFLNKKPKQLPQQESVNFADEASQVEIESVISIPKREKITGSGVAKRESIKIISENFKEIKYIVPQNITEVPKDGLLIEYASEDLYIRKARLENDLKLKNEILTRNKTLDEYSAISKDELNKIQIEAGSAQGELNEINYRISQSKKVAPFDCYVKHHDVIAGSPVSNGQTMLTIFKKNEMLVDMNINLQNLNELKETNLLNKHAVMTFPGGRVVKGKVIYFLNNADPFTASISVTISIDNSKNDTQKIIAGEVCDVKIYTGLLNRMFEVPETAICGEEYDQHVFLIKNNIAYKTPIQKHKQKGEKVIISGIQEGDILVVSGAHRLSHLCKVKVTNG